MADHNLPNLGFNTELLNSLLAHVAIVDANGTILKTNDAWKEFDDATDSTKRPQPGKNYFNTLQRAIEMGNDYALKLLLGLKKALKNKKEDFQLTYSLKKDSKSYWFNLAIRPCSNDDSLFIVIHEDITASIQAKYEKAEYKDRSKLKFEQSVDGIFITDAKGSILEANQTASNILGWARSELSDFTISTVINVNDPQFQSALKQRKKSGNFRTELNFIDKNGNIIPTETSSRTYRDPNGELRAIITFHDISLRKKMERDLLNTKQFTESALNSIPGVFFVIDREGNFIRWNENMVTTLGYTADELTGRNAINFVIPEQQEYVKNQIQRCIQEGEISLDLKLSGETENHQDYSILAKRFVEDGKVYIVGTGIDVTKQKSIERENKRHQTMMEQLFDNAPVGITIVDNDNSIQQVNESFEQIFGYSEKEVIGKNINLLLASEQKREEAKAISLATQKGERLQTETIRVHKNGDEIPVLIGSVPVKLDDEVIAIYGMYVDVSTQHDYREKIKQTLREREALLAELHHRVKNNLALITSLVELQLFDAKGSKLKEELQNIKNRIMTIASIHEVLYQNGNLTNIPFHKFIKKLIKTQVVQQKKRSKNVAFNARFEKFFLNINQSIPAGLLLNEVLSLIFNFTDRSMESTINIQLREYGRKVHLIVEGENMLTCAEKVRKNQSLHNILIETLVDQLGGTFVWPNTETNHQKFEIIFTKGRTSTPASDILEISN